MNTDQAMNRYLVIYQSLFRRMPRELRDLGGNWVLVNGARMSVEELEQISDQLQHELWQEQHRRRGIVNRLLKWFSQ
jgi:hypothetical protein